VRLDAFTLLSVDGMVALTLAAVGAGVELAEVLLAREDSLLNF